jgi:hypothetical protein
MFIKLGELIEISRVENGEPYFASISEEVLEKFRKTAGSLKRIAPKADDFLYFSAVMMHAAESSALNEDGTFKLNAKGEAVNVGWDKTGNTLRWITNDPSIKPYRNSNGDIFPEEELIKAHRKWVHKPLCIDHKSSSVDHVRGFIVDTVYDTHLKRVIALCALDKKNYPDLARKVSTGYSNCVSMGTAVGRAICSDCARVARAESDFCNCMKTKSCYGEINTDLNPIELSIVVNGADQKAKIKHIVAAANTLNTYIEQKEQELNKFAGKAYNASFSVSDDNGTSNNKNVSLSVSKTDLNEFKDAINDAMKTLENLNSEVDRENSGNELASNETSDFDNVSEELESNSSLQSSDKILGTEEALTELRLMTEAMGVKLNNMKQSLDKLANTSNKQEENMSGSKEISKNAYHQGTEEPKPGQVQYSKDPLNEKLRTDGDKQMLGQMDTGPVDGMHPGPDSTSMSELERKKMLARATAEERSMKRTSAVNLAKKVLEDKKAYYLNGDGKENPGTPTPGKQKYPVDKLQDDLREDGDKHMLGQKPFPAVGPVDGMHPSPASADVADEKKRKEMLARANRLTARFVRASKFDGSQDLGRSSWEVFLGDKLLLNASVNELSGNRAEMLFDSIATKDFGSKLIEKIKVHGATKVLSLVKSAAPGDVAPQAPAPAAPAAEMPQEGGDAPELDLEDNSKSGDPKETIKDLANQLSNLSSDLTTAVSAMTGEKAEMGDVPPPAENAPMGSEASFSTAHLNSLRKELNGALTHAMKESVAEMNDSVQELEMINGLYENGLGQSNQEMFTPIFADAVNDAKVAVANGFKLMTAFVKYARGTKAIVKRAQLESELSALDEGDSMGGKSSDDSDLELERIIEDARKHSEDSSDDESLFGDEEDVDADLGDEFDSNDADLTVSPEELEHTNGMKLPPQTNVHVASFDTKAGRAALRAKLAGDTLKMSPMLGEAHPKGGFTTDLDVNPSGDLAKVEDLEEVHDAMMDLANAPVKVRKEAEAIHRLVSEGTLDPSDLNALVAEGLDKDAVAYYKKYYNQVDGGSEFASELVKEHVKASLEEELNVYKVKMARAYELANEMVDRGLCRNDRLAISEQVEALMKFNDENFDSLKRVVAQHMPSMQKSAGRIPQVGMIGSGEISVSNETDDGNLVAQLSAALSKSSRKMF